MYKHTTHERLKLHACVHDIHVDLVATINTACPRVPRRMLYCNVYGTAAGAGQEKHRRDGKKGSAWGK